MLSVVHVTFHLMLILVSDDNNKKSMLIIQSAKELEKAQLLVS